MRRYVRPEKAAKVPAQGQVRETTDTLTDKTKAALERIMAGPTRPTPEWDKMTWADKLAMVSNRLETVYRRYGTISFKGYYHSHQEFSPMCISELDILSEIKLNIVEMYKNSKTKNHIKPIFNSEGRLTAYFKSGINRKAIKINKRVNRTQTLDIASLESLLADESKDGNEKTGLVLYVTKRLKGIDRGVFILYYGQGKTMKEIGSVFKMSFQNISLRLMKIHVKMKSMKIRDYFDGSLIPVVGGIQTRHTVDVSNQIDPTSVTWLRKARYERNPEVRDILVTRHRTESRAVMDRHHAVTLGAVPRDVARVDYLPQARILEDMKAPQSYYDRNKGDRCYIGDLFRQDMSRVLREGLDHAKRQTANAQAQWHRIAGLTPPKETPTTFEKYLTSLASLDNRKGKHYENC